MTKTKRTIYLVLGTLVFFSAVTIINPLQTSDLFASFVKQVTVVNGTDMPIPVVVQNGTNIGRESVEFLLQGYDTSDMQPQSVEIFTVPTGKALIITDVLVSVASGSVFKGAEIRRDGTAVSFIQTFVGVYQHSYHSGIEFSEGQLLTIFAPTNAHTNWELRGYLTDIT